LDVIGWLPLRIRYAPLPMLWMSSRPSVYSVFAGLRDRQVVLDVDRAGEKIEIRRRSAGLRDRQLERRRAGRIAAGRRAPGERGDCQYRNESAHRVTSYATRVLRSPAMSRDAKLVFTSDPEEARRLRESGRMPEARDVAYAQQTIRVELDRKARKGKSVTLASGFELTPQTLNDIGKALKSKCGSGGTVKESAIEIQGDHRDRVAAELSALGFRVKKIN
jgi:predicted translation initiation factor SUI1